MRPVEPSNYLTMRRRSKREQLEEMERARQHKATAPVYYYQPKEPTEMERLTAVLQKQAARVAQHQRRCDDLVRGYWDDVNDMGLKAWANYDLAAQKTQMLKAETNARIEKERAKLAADMAALRAEAAEVEAKAKAKADAVLYDGLHANDPKTPTEWSGAAAREQLLRSELAEAGPEKIMRGYLELALRDDAIGKYAAERVARELLKKLTADQVRGAAAALGDLDGLTIRPAHKAHEDALLEIRYLLGKINGPQTPDEKAAIGAKYGIKTYDDPFAQPPADPGDGPQFEASDMAAMPRSSGAVY